MISRKHALYFSLALASPLLSAEARGFQVSASDTAMVQRYMEQQACVVSKSVERFTQLTQPYAPLDFQVREATNAHASAVRNYLFGAASAAAGLNSSVAPNMATKFHCGEPCATARIKAFVEEHEQVSALVMRFVPLSAVSIVAQWGTPGDFRINDTFLQGGLITTFKPLGSIAILPNSFGETKSNWSQATGLTPSEIAEAKAIAIELASLGLAAIVRSPQGIRVVRGGNADNENGLLFKKLSEAAPKAGDNFGEGLDVDGVTLLAKDIYYFETN